VNILPGLLRLDGLSLDDISMATPQRSLVKVEILNFYFGGPRQRVFKHPPGLVTSSSFNSTPTLISHLQISCFTFAQTVESWKSGQGLDSLGYE
jgi:hypothetical protein